MTEKQMEQLLFEFDRIPKVVYEPTYLDLCRYPRRRFEEICSRLLQFFFSPQNEHGFRDLLLKSLFETITTEKVTFNEDRVVVLSEDDADGKRLDLLIYSDSFVLGIENKINAKLYNPLAQYKNRIEQYKSDNIFKIVLSLNEIKSEDELNLIVNNDFKNITYSQFFGNVKKNIGHYLAFASQKYAAYLMDFIQTIETMSMENSMNENLSTIFFDNKSRIQELTNLFKQHNDRVFNIQTNRINEIFEDIKKASNDSQWWVYDKWDLGYSYVDSNGNKIGLECSFQETRNNPLGEFRIYITSWEYNSWMVYEKQILERYPNKFLDKVNNRVYLHINVIDNDDNDLIIKSLLEYHFFLSELLKKY